MMQRTTLRWVTLLGALTILALLGTQSYWLVRALSLQEKEFSQAVHMALKETAQQIREFNNTPGPMPDPVDQLSDNYYVVQVNDVIDANVLEHFLTQNLQARNVQEDFEYGVYDCIDEQLAYGNYVALTNVGNPESPTQLPRLDKDNYYFGVFFPNKSASLRGELAFMVGAAGLTLLLVGFFAWTLVVISRQRRLSEVQRDFINNMTHEFKTPLSTVAISSAVLKDPGMKGGADRVQNYAGIIHEEANHLLAQVERVLSMAREDRGVENLKITTLPAKETIEKVLDQHRVVLSDSGAELSLQLEAEGRLSADPLHFTNMLFNLLDNAVKYSSGTPKIKVSSRNVGHAIEIAVTDQGIGLSPRDQQRIFDKFYRVPTGNVHDVKGFGLGLTYVYRMMQRHKGKVRLRSQLGKGSTFTLIFPKAK